MQIQIEKEQNVLILKPTERRLDATSAEEFRDQLMEVVEEGNRRIVLDVSDVEFIDSTGLSVIIFARKSMGEDGRFVISEACETIETLFKLTRMDKVFPMFSATVDAVEALKE